MGVAYADFDRDGLVDFVVGNFDVGYTLYRNAGLAGAGNHWLAVRLEGRPPVNRDAIGARMFVTPGAGRPRMQEVKNRRMMAEQDRRGQSPALPVCLVRVAARRAMPGHRFHRLPCHGVNVRPYAESSRATW